MNLARLSRNGQITVPVEIRRRLRLAPGDKLLFVERPSGEIVVSNAAQSALATAQDAFAGTADDFGGEDEIQQLVDDLRAARR